MGAAPSSGRAASRAHPERREPGVCLSPSSVCSLFAPLSDERAEGVSWPPGCDLGVRVRPRERGDRPSQAGSDRGPGGALGPGWSQPVWGPGKASVSDPGLTAQRRAAQSRLPARSGPHSNTWLLPQPLGTGQAGKVRRGRSRPGEQRPGHTCRHLRLVCLYSRARRCLRCRSEARGFKRASRGSLTFVYVWKRGFPPGSWSLASSSHSLMGTAVRGRGLRFLETFPSCSYARGKWGLTQACDFKRPQGKRPCYVVWSQAESCDLARKYARGTGLVLWSPLETPDTLEAQPPASSVGLGAPPRSDRCF